jgi:GNAT superfamily N-acetyltransferase
MPNITVRQARSATCLGRSGGPRTLGPGPYPWHVADDPELLAFAEDPDVFLPIGTDEERVVTDPAVVTFGPGAHFWSTTVARVRLGSDVASALSDIRRLIGSRGRHESVWVIGPSSRPADVVNELTARGLEPESESGSAILLLTREPAVRASAFEVRLVGSFDEHLASILVGNEGFGFSPHDAEDEVRRARETFEAERDDPHVCRLLAYRDDRPVAVTRAWFAPQGVYIGGVATIPSHRGRGAMSSLIGAAWLEAAARRTPALVAHTGEMSTSPLMRLGFRNVGRSDHLIDRFDV